MRRFDAWNAETLNNRLRESSLFNTKNEDAGRFALLKQYRKRTLCGFEVSSRWTEFAGRPDRSGNEVIEGDTCPKGFTLRDGCAGSGCSGKTVENARERCIALLLVNPRRKVFDELRVSFVARIAKHENTILTFLVRSADPDMNDV